VTTKPVVLVVPGALATRTGGYGYDRRIAEGLRERGWQVDVCELGGGFPQPTAATRREADARVAAIPDGVLVLADGLAFGALPELALREAARLRFVALVHHPLAAETGLDEPSRAALLDSERRALAAARLVVVTRAATARALAEYGVAADRVVVVCPGTDAAPPARGSRGTGLESTEPFDLLTVATLVPRKGHDVLLHALGRARHLPWRLTCVGSDMLHPATAGGLRVQAQQLGMAERVEFTGELDGRALADAYDRADLFVLATRYEGFGMAVAEAVARGLPVVSTPTGGIPDLVDGDSGWLVPPDDADALAHVLEAFMTDAALRLRLAAGAERRRHLLPTWAGAAAAMAAALERASR
jgi:glycosyltransferase involved in cell wall biosynthesis